MFTGTGRLTVTAIIRIVASAIKEYADGQRDFPFLLRGLRTLFRL